MKLKEEYYIIDSNNFAALKDRDKYIEFTTFRQAEEFGKDNYEEWGKCYKTIMHLAGNYTSGSCCSIPIEAYCGNQYEKINSYLRNDSDNECNTYREISDILSIILCSAPRIPDNIVLYRAVCDEFIEKLIEENNDIGQIQEKGFMSTSMTLDIASNTRFKDNINVLKLYVPKGTIGCYVNVICKRSEEEMLLVPKLFLEMIAKPYYNKEYNKMIFECKVYD